MVSSSLCYADKITLPNGKVLEGEVIEETDEYMVVKQDGVSIPMTYYKDIDYDKEYSEHVEQEKPVEKEIS